MEYLLLNIAMVRPVFGRIFSPVFAFGRHLYDHVVPSHRNNYHPHILGHRSLALISILLVTVKIFSLSVLAFGAVDTASSAAITTENIISLTNESRLAYGLAALSENQQLKAAAQAKAEDMLAKGYFAHNTPDGKTPWDFIVSAGYTYLQAGENLAVNFLDAEDVEAAWMNSPGHKANILNKHFQEIGIGIAQGTYQGHNAIFVVQEFGLAAQQKVLLSEEPTVVEGLGAKVPAAKVTDKKAVLDSASLGIVNAEVVAEDQTIKVKAEIAGPAVKVLAYFGGQAVMLNPKEYGVWEADVPWNQITSNNPSVRIVAIDMGGQTVQTQLADFAEDTKTNFSFINHASAAERTALFMGTKFNPKNLEHNFYLIFIAAFLTCLIMAILIKRHIQHLALIANSGFVAMLAILLWWVG